MIDFYRLITLIRTQTEGQTSVSLETSDWSPGLPVLRIITKLHNSRGQYGDDTSPAAGKFWYEHRFSEADVYDAKVPTEYWADQITDAFNKSIEAHRR